MNTLNYLLITIGSLISLVVVQIIVFRKFGNAFVQNIGDGINQLFGKETVKRAMTIVGKQGGDTKAVNAIKGQLAKGFIDKNYGMVKMVAQEVAGVDVDGMMGKYGAENILVAVRQFAPALGIDLDKMIANFMGGQGLNTNQPVVYPKEE